MWRLMLGVLLMWVGGVYGQDYPNRPIRIVTSGIGGSNDIPARLIAQALTVSMGQPVIVENRPSGLIPGQIVSQAPPDGYTLLVAGGAFVIGPFLQKTPYDPVKDFVPVTLVSRQPSVLVVHPSLPVKSIPELITLAKTRPGELNYGASGIGSTSHLAAELFNSMANVKIIRINYKGPTPLLIDLIGGQVQLTFATASSVAPYLNPGKLKALAATSAEPSALALGLTTVAASGLPGYAIESNQIVLAPAKTPDAIVKRLHFEIVRYLNLTETKEKFFNAGTEVVGGSPEQLAAAMKSEIARMGKVIKDAGISAN